MLNLAGSHDTNRVRFVLSHGQKPGGGDLSADETDAYQKLLALLQFTLPGAPTVYYGDEVGVESPGRLYGGKYEDDPYNRVPFPWDDTPGYYSARSGIREHYRLLGQARAAHPALRVGSFDTLLADDAARVYAYGRRLPAPTQVGLSGPLAGSRPSPTETEQASTEVDARRTSAQAGRFQSAPGPDAAIIILNRDAVTHTVVVDVGGYLGAGAVFTDVLSGGAVYTVSASGRITLPNLAPMSGALLVYADGDILPPAPPVLTATEGAGQVVLTWSPVTDAVAYTVYRSLLSGGGYTAIATVPDPVYTDTAVANGTIYYYVVTALDGAGNESRPSGEVAAMPHHRIGWANLQWPPQMTHTIGLTPTDPFYGQVWIDGVTNQPGATPGLLAQVGFGPTDTPPVSWTGWTDAVFNTDVGNNDEFRARLVPEYTGTFHVVYRYSTTGGRDWVYADRSGLISPTGVVSPAVLYVLPSADTTPPAAPQNLRVTRWGADHIALAWDPVAAADLYAYDLYRAGPCEGVPAARCGPGPCPLPDDRLHRHRRSDRLSLHLHRPRAGHVLQPLRVLQRGECPGRGPLGDRHLRRDGPGLHPAGGHRLHRRGPGGRLRRVLEPLRPAAGAGWGEPLDDHAADAGGRAAGVQIHPGELGPGGEVGGHRGLRQPCRHPHLGRRRDDDGGGRRPQLAGPAGGGGLPAPRRDGFPPRWPHHRDLQPGPGPGDGDHADGAGERRRGDGHRGLHQPDGGPQRDGPLHPRRPAEPPRPLPGPADDGPEGRGGRRAAAAGVRLGVRLAAGLPAGGTAEPMIGRAGYARHCNCLPPPSAGLF